jgi:hypothetical protein
MFLGDIGGEVMGQAIAVSSIPCSSGPIEQMTVQIEIHLEDGVRESVTYVEMLS